MIGQPLLLIVTRKITDSAGAKEDPSLPKKSDHIMSL